MEVHFVDVKSGKRLARKLPCVVGRGDDAGFRIRNDSVSRSHCRFAVEGGVVRVTDLGSTNGTFVDKRRLAANTATPVPSGAQVRIGGIVLRVEYSAASAAKAEPSRDDETMPMAASAVSTIEAAEIPELEPVVDQLPELEPLAQVAEDAGAAPAVAPPDESTPPAPAADAVPFAGIEPAAPTAEAPAFQDVEPASAPADGSFEFLGAAEPAAPADDDNLNDFFKSLS